MDSVKKTFCLFAIFSFTISFAASPLNTGILTVEYLENPLGIDVEKPRFSWTLISEQRNQKQAAFEIIVSDNIKDISAGKGNVWTSGKINSSQSLHIEYAGQGLNSFTKYYWRVKVHDNNNEGSQWSAINSFETAMLRSSDWKANWISDGSRQFEKDEDFYKDDPMPLLKKSFRASKKIASARLYIAGLGYYEAYLNGKKIGDRVLEPGFTSYRKQVLYSTFDITSQVKSGMNLFGVMLGNGWYNPLPIRLFGRFNLRDVQQTGRPCVKSQILIRYTDGTVETIVSDSSWLTAPGAILRNNVYLGEHYDARLEKTSWFTINASGWKNASIVSGPDGSLISQIQPPVRISSIVKPLRIYEAGKDTFIVDMGQNFAGVARIKVQAPAGTKINIRYGEDTLARGRLNFYTTVAGQIKEVFRLSGGPGSPETAWQEDGYIVKREGTRNSGRHGLLFTVSDMWKLPDGRASQLWMIFEGLRMNTDLAVTGNILLVRMKCSTNCMM